MKNRAGFKVTFLIAAMLLSPFQSFALSVKEYEAKPKQERAEAIADAIEKIISDVARVNPPLSKAIHDYFYVTPKGKPAAPGVTAFEAELVVVENLADKGKLDLDKVQIEGILLEVIKLDVMPNQKSKDKQPLASK